MKKSISLLLALLMVFSLCACGEKTPVPEEPAAGAEAPGAENPPGEEAPAEEKLPEEAPAEEKLPEEAPAEEKQFGGAELLHSEEELIAAYTAVLTDVFEEEDITLELEMETNDKGEHIYSHIFNGSNEGITLSFCTEDKDICIMYNAPELDKDTLTVLTVCCGALKAVLSGPDDIEAAANVCAAKFSEALDSEPVMSGGVSAVTNKMNIGGLYYTFVMAYNSGHYMAAMYITDSEDADISEDASGTEN